MSKILIVDDEPYIRLLLEQSLEAFEDQGVQLISCDNGIDAFKLIKEQRPRLVFLDVMMPGMNGFDVCQKVKSDSNLKHIYIILLTAKGQEFDRREGEAAGCDLYMTKPFDPDAVLEKAAEILEIQL